MVQVRASVAARDDGSWIPVKPANNDPHERTLDLVVHMATPATLCMTPSFGRQDHR